jgi:hypothetical protein
LETRGECVIEKRRKRGAAEWGRLYTELYTRLCTLTLAGQAHLALYHSFLSTGRWNCTQCCPLSLNLWIRHLDFENLLPNHSGTLSLFENWTKIANRIWTGSEQIH